MARVVQEEIQLNQKTPGVTLSAGTANVDSQIAAYAVPQKSQLEIRASDFIAMYLAAAGPAEIAADSVVTIIRTDPQGRRTKVLAQGEYAQFKEFTDAMKKYFFKGKTEVIEGNFRLLMKVLSATAVDDTLTRFTLSCKNIYETLE